MSGEFFTKTVETIDRTQCAGFHHFDQQHLLWLLVLLLSVLFFTGIYRKAIAHRRLICRLFSAVLCAEEVTKLIVVICNGVPLSRYLPLQLCSICVIVVMIDGLVSHRKNAPVHECLSNFLYLIGLPAALSALLFPSWTVLPAWGNMMSLQSFTSHILMVAYIVMIIAGGEFQLKVKTVPVNVTALCLLAYGVYRCNLILGTNFMYLMKLSAGSPLAPFAALGDYRIGYAIILAALILALYGIPLSFKHAIKK